MQLLLRMHTDLYTLFFFDTHFFVVVAANTHSQKHTHIALLPKWLVWDSNGDSYNNISTCCGTEQRQRETAADAALTAPGLP